MRQVDFTSESDILVNVAVTSRWGTEGENGGKVSITAINQELSGSLISDEISTISVTLLNGSTLSGSINAAYLTLDETSTWNVGGYSNLTYLVDPVGISDNVIEIIIGNGCTVYYDPSLEENRLLGGEIYTLREGGQLIPK